MIHTIKQKLYRTKRTKHLEKKLGIACQVYNHCIAAQKTYYRLFKSYLSKSRLQAHLAKLKQRYAWWKQVNSQTIQNIVERIDFGYQKFFRKQNKRPPTFRSRYKYKSLTYKTSGWKVERNRLTIQGLVFKFHRSRRDFGNLKRITIKRDSVGDWHVSFTCEVNKESQSRVKTGKTAGFDFGLKTFLTSDSGDTYQSPLFYKNGIKGIGKASRNLSRRKKGSNNRGKARINLARVHRKIANRRLDHHFKLARELALKYDSIFIEDLNMEGMKRLWGQKVSDLGFAQFVNILKWICKKLGSELVVIDRFYPSSKTCNVCEHVKEDLILKDREWTCSKCRTNHNRDTNAAVNIKRVGASTLSGERVRASSLAIVC